jgi:hypothetical protein
MAQNYYAVAGLALALVPFGEAVAAPIRRCDGAVFWGDSLRLSGRNRASTGRATRMPSGNRSNLLAPQELNPDPHITNCFLRTFLMKRLDIN